MVTGYSQFRQYILPFDNVTTSLVDDNIILSDYLSLWLIHRYVPE